MNTIVNEELISFKELEKKIYSYVCELAREITTQVLESYDKELAETRDKKQNRGKGKRSTTIKTVYGEVEYSRNVYRTQTTDGQSISAGGVWNMMQRLGERIDEEEVYAVKQMDADQTEGEEVIPVLFEEMDGVWLHIQDEHHKKMKKQEIIETISAAKAPKKDGKGNPYADRLNHHMPLFEAMQTASRKAFKRAFGY